MRLKICPGNSRDLEPFYPDGLPYSGKIIAVRSETETLGICGVLHGPTLQAFSNIEPELKKYPGAIWRAGKALQDLIRTYHSTVIAVADPEQITAPALLKRLGFEPFQETEQGVIYLCKLSRE